MTDKSKFSDNPSVADIFWQTDLYPDAVSLLGYAFPMIEEIKKVCFVVLDANVLLQPYEVDSKEAVLEIERVYKFLAGEGRLIVPGQAAREYTINRPKKIAAVVRRIEAAIKRLSDTQLEKIPILEGDPIFGSVKSDIDGIRESCKDAIKKLKSLVKSIRDNITADQIAILYRDVLASCVMDTIYSADERGDIVNDLKRRRRLQIGPGLTDSDKPDLGIGDLIIWKDIIAQGVARKQHCLFVSQETKPDWWARDSDRLQLRPELIDEYRQQSDGFHIHMVPLSGLLQLFDANPEAVSKVEDAETRDQPVVSESMSATYQPVISPMNKDDARRFYLLTQEKQILEGDIENIRNHLRGFANDQHIDRRGPPFTEPERSKFIERAKQSALYLEEARQQYASALDVAQRRLDTIEGRLIGLS